MSGAEIYITRLSAWAPGITSPGEWDEWAADKRSISREAKGPDISFTDSMFRRRLSQISKMTIQVAHDLLPLGDDTKIFFISFRGEISKQYQINKMLIEEKELSPAAFSLSVFNAPVALATMALGLKGGYSALYPAENSFATGMKAAQAAILCGSAEEIAVIYADEQVPPEYSCFFTAPSLPPPAAFALLLSRSPQAVSIPLSSLNMETANALDFLKQLLLRGEIHVTP